MMALKLLATFSCLMVVCYSVDPTQTTRRPHPALFFSNKPALKDLLGLTIDTASVTLACVGGSRDNRRVHFKWYKDGTLMKADSSPIIATIPGDLTINPSDYTRDDGFYRCLITDNTWSLLSNMAELRLAYISGIRKNDVTVSGTQYEGWKHIYTGYKRSKYPKPKFIWKFNGRILKETKHISISEEGNLYIAQLSLNDAGKYSFEMQLGSLKQQRESINLQVARSSRSTDIYGTVMLGPKDRRVSLKREKEVTFECFATGWPLPDITWKKGTRTLVNGQKFVMSNFNKRLTIKNLNKADSGKYVCAITRAASSKFPQATLTVIEPPVIKALEPANQVRHIGNFTTLTCMVTGTLSNVRFSVKWYRNGIKLSQSSRITIRYKTYRGYRNYTLNVTKLNKDVDSGMYQCFAKSDGGEDMAYTAVNVQSMPPYIYYGPGVVYAVLGRTAKIVCRSRGSPPITYTWEKNGREIKYLNPPDNGKNGTYVIQRVRSSDVAQYTCIASNGKTLGDMYKSSGRLELVSPTVVVNKSITIYASKGSDPYLYCGVRYDKKVNVTYRWYFDGDRIDRSSWRYKVDRTLGRLTISSVNEVDNGIYRCDSSSGVGDFSTTIELVVQAPPYKTTIPQVDSIRPDSVRLLWKAGYDGNSAIQYFKIGVKIPINKTEITLSQQVMASGVIRKYIVPGLTPYTQYQFRMKAVNYVGGSPWSEYSNVIRTREASPSYKLKNLKGTAVNENTIEVTWEVVVVAIRSFLIIGTTYTGTDRSTCNKSVGVNNIVPSCQQAVGNLSTSWEQAIRIHPDDKLLKQHWFKSAAGSLQDDPPKSTHNGILRGYYVNWRYQGATSVDFRKHKVTPATTRKLRITGLILNSRYEVKVQMYNDAGAGPFSDLLYIKTKEGVPASAPRNLAVRNVSSRSVVLQWDEPPQQYWNGDITQYTIRLWEFDKKEEVEQRVAKHDGAAFTQVFNVTNLKTYTQYTFEVSAQNSVGGSPFSKPVQVRTTEDIPSAPQNLQIVDQFSDTISVKWVRPREVNGVLTGYIVKYWKVDDAGRRVGKIMKDEVAGGALQAGITSLQARTRYMIEVAAKTNAGISKSAKIEGRTENVAQLPKPPTGLRFLEINATALELTWQEGWKGNSPIIKYIIQGNNETGFANDRNSEWFDALIVKDPYKIYNLPPVIIEDLIPATTYRFRVKAVNKVGSSSLSDVSGDVTTSLARPWSPPVNIRVKPAQYPGELFLTWDPPPRETWNSEFIKYTVELQEDGERGNFTKYAISGIRGNARRYRLTSLKKYTSYEIKMKTVNQLGDSPYSPAIIYQTQEYVPEAPPSNIRAIGMSGSSIEISWDEVPETGRNGIVRGYKIFYRLVQYAPQDFIEIKLGDVKQHTLEKLLGYTRYDIRIRAYTRIGDGKLSDRLQPYPRTLETKPGPPSNLRFPTITSSVVVVTWAPPEMTGGNITQYRVSYRLRDDGSSKLVTRPTLAATKQSDSITDLSLEKFYIFEVQAYTAVGWGEKASAEIYTSQDRNSEKPQRPIILPISDSHITWRSIKVRWAVARRRNQPIRYFTLRLRKAQGAWETHPKPFTGDDDEMVVWGLESNHLYSFEITATNDAGTSPPSKPSPPVRTLAKSMPGSPREVRITSPTPTSFTITWKPPFLADIETTIKKYRVSYRLHEPNPSRNPAYLDVVVTASRREYLITGLDEYTLYNIRLNAIDANNDNLPSYLETRRTSAERPRRPSLSDNANAGPTSVTIFWGAPGKTKTPLLGYKAVYTIPSRRRRAVREVCETPEPGAAYFSNTSTSGTIRGLQMYARYVIVLRSFNTAGDSDPSVSISVRTAEGVPGPPAVFDFDGVYDLEVHVYWEAPCQPNGVITKYILTVSTGTRQVQRKEFNEDTRGYKVVGLARITTYKFKLVARTSRGEGISKVLETRTTPPSVKPFPPKIMRVTSEYNAVTLTWKDQFHGNTPITKYVIEYRTSTEKNPWVSGWSLNPSETTKNRTDRTVWVVLRDLEPHTVYWFRMKVQNKVGYSNPSDSSPSVSTGAAVPGAQSAPIYEEIWFIAVMSVIGFLILLLCICICLLCCRRRRRRKYLSYPVPEMELNTGLRPYSSYEETLSNGGSKTHRDEKPLVDDVEGEESEPEEDEEEEASSLETKSNLSQSDESSDDISTKKRKMEAALREQDKNALPRSYSTEQLHNSPPPAYATFASNRNKGRSEPALDPYADFDDGVSSKPYQLPYRPPTRRSAFEPYDGESSESSDLANRKRGDPRSSSFRRALGPGGPSPGGPSPGGPSPGGPSQPEPERPYEPNRKPQPRKYRSLEKAVNENAKPPSYHDDDDDDDVGSRQPSLPPEYRSDSGRDSSDADHDRTPLTQAPSRYNPQDRAESPAPEYDSDDSSEKHRLTNGKRTPQPEISSYSASFV